MDVPNFKMVSFSKHGRTRDRKSSVLQNENKKFRPKRHLDLWSTAAITRRHSLVRSVPHATGRWLYWSAPGSTKPHQNKTHVTSHPPYAQGDPRPEVSDTRKSSPDYHDPVGVDTVLLPRSTRYFHG